MSESLTVIFKKMLGGLALILFVTPASLGSVIIITVHKSSQKPSITVRFNGEAVSNVKLEIEREIRKKSDVRLHGPDDNLVLITDDKGQARLPKLSSGWYLVHASVEPARTGSFYLHISSTPTIKHRWFILELEQGVTYEQRIAAYEALPIEAQLSEFHGVVTDFANDPVANASIEVILKGTEGKKRVTFHSDSLGRFSGHLDDGDYLSIIQGGDLRERVEPFTIKKQEGGDGLELQVKLQSDYTN